MEANNFFICPVCGNDKECKVFFSSFKSIKQSPLLGMRTEESGILPNLRAADNYIECSWCSKRYKHDAALVIGRRYIQALQRLQRKTT
ncbi:MAG: hypothetical protein FJ264_04160 [Planctomycetes bacterium]|nr:hypothetical protein [Planctomycetota bacterium]